MPKVDRNKERTGTELAKWVKLKSSEKEEELYDFKGPVEEIEVTQESRQKDSTIMRQLMTMVW